MPLVGSIAGKRDQFGWRLGKVITAFPHKKPAQAGQDDFAGRPGHPKGFVFLRYHLYANAAWKVGFPEHRKASQATFARLSLRTGFLAFLPVFDGFLASLVQVAHDLVEYRSRNAQPVQVNS